MKTRSADIRLESLSKQFGKSTAVDGVSLEIEPGSMVALLGPSGCGKTTCLRMIAGLVLPTQGRIMLNGSDITGVPVHRRNMGMLFQNYALFPQNTVAENIAFSLDMRRVPKTETAKRVNEALELVQLSGHGDRFPSQLSGGQQQRVALARALVFEPDVLLLDEPLAALDKGLRENMQVELRTLQQKLSITTIIVTHDQDEALTMADHIVVMRDGRIEQNGSAKEIYQKPASEFVATFLGASNLFRCEVVQSRSGTLLRSGDLMIESEDSAAGQDFVTVSVRPEAVSLALVAGRDPSPNTVSGRIAQIIYRGFVTHYHVQMDKGGTLIAYDQNRSAGERPIFDIGDAVSASWKVSGAHIIPTAH